MVHLRFVFSYLTAFVFFVGCSIDNQPEGSSTLIFKLPDSSQQKASSKALFSANGCFAINILGDKIDSATPSTCDVSYGVFAGLVGDGGTIELLAPYGKNRTIEIFYVEVAGGCSKFDQKTGLGHTFGTNKVHRIAHSTGHNFDKPIVEAVVNIEYPKSSNTLATLLPNLPSSCIQGTNPGQLMVSAPANIVLGAAHGTTQNGSKVFVRIVNQNLDLNNTSGSSVRIRPIRLGESQ